MFNEGSNMPAPLLKLCKLQVQAANVEDLQGQVSILKDALFRAFQEIEALKQVLVASNKLEPEQHKQQLVRTMLRDHSAAGPSPWTSHSYYRYFYSEQEYLSEVLQMSKEDVADFTSSAEHAETLT